MEKFFIACVHDDEIGDEHHYLIKKCRTENGAVRKCWRYLRTEYGKRNLKQMRIYAWEVCLSDSREVVPL